MIRFVKYLLRKTVFRPNRVYRILKGPMRDLRFKITLNTEWSPIIGNWEPLSQYIFTKLIRPNHTVFDLGANTGIHALLFSKLIGKGGHLIAFEPVPDNIEEITHNLKINNFENCKIEKIAVSNYEGETVFNLGVNHKTGSLMGNDHENGRTINVQVSTLDKYCESKNIKPDFIKIDIEGGEKEALAGFNGFVSQSYPIIYVESHTLENELAIGKFLSQHNYVVYRIKKDCKSDIGIKHLQLVKEGEGLFPDNKRGDGTVVAIHLSKIKNYSL